MNESQLRLVIEHLEDTALGGYWIDVRRLRRLQRQLRRLLRSR